MENKLFKALKNKKVTRKEIIPIYVNLIYFGDLVNWKKVNKAIINNMGLSLQVLKGELKRKQDQVLTLEDNITFSRLQIERAEKEGKDSFDNSKFNVKR